MRRGRFLALIGVVVVHHAFQASNTVLPFHVQWELMAKRVELQRSTIIEKVRNIWSIVSELFLYIQHQEGQCRALLFRLSPIDALFLRTDHMNNLVLGGL